VAQQQQRARQLWPHALPARARDDDVLMDGSTERRPESTVHQSVSPSRTGRARARALAPSEARLVAWLELYAVGAIPESSRPAPVDMRAGRGAFVGGRRFVLKFGAPLILEALHEMTYLVEDYRGTGFSRLWRAAIVSPAQYLNWLVQELAATGALEDRVERRLHAVEGGSSGGRRDDD